MSRISKIIKKADKTILNILSVFIAGAGLFAASNKYKVPEINYSFWGSNPFAIKKDIIDGVLTWYFIVFALLGLLFRFIPIICKNNISIERKYNNKFYIKFSIITLFLMFISVVIIGNIGRYVAKGRWFPLVIQNQKEAFIQAKYIIEHDGLRDDQLRQKDLLDDIEKYRKINYESAEKILNQIERLLEIKSNSKKIDDRVRYLEQFLLR